MSRWAPPLLVGLVLLAGAAVALGAKNGEGDLIVSLEGGIDPVKLPRTELAPVSIEVSGDVESASQNSESLPQLRRIMVAINSGGRLFDRGLPVCTPKRIQPAREDEARKICGDALVGSGHVDVQVRFRSQPPFLVRAKALAFNGPRAGGSKWILVQIYAADPPGTILLPFEVIKKKGVYGTVLVAKLPQSAYDWAYLLHFDLSLHREYVFRGVRRSYVSASCAAPQGFYRAFFPLARATYSFDTGQHLSVTQPSTCRVAPGSAR